MYKQLANTLRPRQVKAADDDAGNLQPVFLKSCICFISVYFHFVFLTQVKQPSKDTNYDHLKYDFMVLQLLFHFEVKCSFFHISVFNS